MSASRILQVEAQLREAMAALDKSTLPRREVDRLIILAADMADSAKRIRKRAMKFKHPVSHANDNTPRN